MRKREAGTTLLELLIAVTLVSLISVGIMMAMRVGLSALSKTNDKLYANRRVVSVQRIMESEIAGLVPLITECRPDPSQPGPRIPFFEGRPDEMRFVSSYSLQEASRGYPRVLEFRVIPGENGEGVRLIVNELFYAGILSPGTLCAGIGNDPDTGAPFPMMRQVEAGAGSFVLADKLAFCRMSYRAIVPPPVLELWGPVWTRPFFPSAIRIEMAPLAPDPSRLQLSTLTIPVRVFRRHLEPYED